MPPTSEANPQTDTCPRANGETSLEPQISQIAQIIMKMITDFRLRIAE